MLELYRILEILNTSREITQRDISVQANISLGKTNNLINNLVNRDFITVEKFGKGSVYRLTSKGIEFLEQWFKITASKRLSLHEKDYKKISTAVIIATDKIKESQKTIGLLEIDGITIINRTINILRNNDISNIIIVSGEKNKDFNEIEKEDDITLIKNTKYKGTMTSLTLAKEYINDDFILIDSNIIFEEKAVIEVLNTKMRDCILITSETGSGDEIYIEIDNDYVYKIFKDINLAKNVAGELVGITKISYKIYLKMLKEYESNENEYLSYKRQLIDISNSYRVGYINIDDLTWYKISNNSHYEKVLDIIYPMIKQKELSIDINNIKKIIMESLGIDKEEVTNIFPAGGMTNKNYKFLVNDTFYILRIPGNGTKEMINREEEKLNSELAASIGINMNRIYVNKNTGIIITKLEQNPETLNHTTSKKEKNMKLIAELLRKLHNSKIKMANEFKYFEIMNHYEKLAIQNGGKFYDGYYTIKDYVLRIIDKLQEFNYSLAPCHNDPVPENFIKCDSNKIYLIDWEYAGLNDPLWDIAAFCLESNFYEDEVEVFLQIYFCGNVEENIKERILKYKICQDFLWSIWAIIKQSNGDDFGTYGLNRFKRCKDNIFSVLNSHKNFH